MSIIKAISNEKASNEKTLATLKKRKIRIMSKLAIYDKHFREIDKKILKFFRYDYIYKENMRTRLFAGIGGIIIVVFWLLHKASVKGIDFLVQNYKAETMKCGIFLLILLVFYTFIGTIISAKRYEISKKRQASYIRLLNYLDALEVRLNQQRRKEASFNETNFTNKRNNN